MLCLTKQNGRVIVLNTTLGRKEMARPKILHGGNVGVRLPRDIDLCLRAASLETGKSLSDLIRETLARTWGKGQKAQEIRAGQSHASVK